MTVPKSEILDLEDKLAKGDEFSLKYVLRRARSYARMNPVILDIEGRANFMLERFPQAVEDFALAYEMTGHDSYLFNLALGYIKTEREDEAIEILNDMIDRHVEDPRVYILTGELHLADDRPEDAIRVVGEGKSVSPLAGSLPDFLIVESIAFMLLGDEETAKAKTLDVFRLLLSQSREIEGFSDLPDSYEGCLRGRTLSSVNKKNYLDLVERWIEESKLENRRPHRTMSRARKQYLRNRLKERIHPRQVDELSDEELAQNDLAVFHAMEPYRIRANQMLD